MKPEAVVLAHAFEQARGLTKYYTGLCKDQDPYKVFQFNDQKLNSLYWLNAHLAWAEDFLILGGCHGKRSGISWLDSFGFGTKPEEAKGPSFAEVLESGKEVHQKVIDHFLSIPDEDIEKPNSYNFNMGGNNSVRNMLTHAIRHEGTHAGHIGWLCKFYGIKTV